MRRIWAVGAVIAAAAAGAAAPAASALPEVGRCVAQAGTGRYKDAGCTEKAGAKASEKQFEWLKGAVHKGFTTAGGEVTLETQAPTKIVCAASSASGEYRELNGAIKEVRAVVLRFTSCSLPIGPVCHTAGAAEGEFVSNALKGPLGYVSGKGTSTPVVGQQLTPEAAKAAFVEFECDGGTVMSRIGKPSGAANKCVIAEVTPVRTMSASFEWAFHGSAGTQSPGSFELGVKPCNLETNTNGGRYERVDLSFTETVASEEALEIKA